MNNTFNSPWLTNDYSNITDLLKLGHVKEYPKGYTIVKIGEVVDRIFYVLEGSIKIGTNDNAGREKIFFIAGEGKIIGDSMMYIDEPKEIFIAANIDCKLCEIPFECVKEYLLEHRDLQFEILRTTAYKFEILLNQLADLSFENSRRRVIRLLCRIAHDHGKRTEDGIKISLKITHEELAELISCSRVSVSRELSYLRSKEIIDYNREYINILDLEKLNKIALI